MYCHCVSESYDYLPIRTKEELKNVLNHNGLYDKTINDDISDIYIYDFDNSDKIEKSKYLLHFIINHSINELNKMKAFIKHINTKDINK